MSTLILLQSYEGDAFLSCQQSLLVIRIHLFILFIFALGPVIPS